LPFKGDSLSPDRCQVFQGAGFLLNGHANRFFNDLPSVLSDKKFGGRLQLDKQPFLMFHESRYFSLMPENNLSSGFRSFFNDFFVRLVRIADIVAD
jgi:hypothetical protein